MGDPEVATKATTNINKIAWGFSPGYLFSCAGFLRICNIILGAVCIGLWAPGYEPEFLGERINQNSQDTTKGYGNGYSRESLNQFVMAAITICLICSVLLLLGLVAVQHASVDWNRLNKVAHLGLGLFLFIGGICSIFGVWYFQENCCHVDMSFGGSRGITYDIITRRSEGYARHCHCYLTRHLGQSDQETVTDTILWDATKSVDTSGFMDGRWEFVAHHVYPHVAAIFIIFLNAIVYFLGFVFSKVR